MEKLQSLIGKLMLLGMLISVALVAVGGIIYLIQHGMQPMPLFHFHPQPIALQSINGVWHDALTFSAAGIIQLGLLALLITQIARVALTGGLFLKLHDLIFSGISLFVLCVLLYTSLWRF